MGFEIWITYQIFYTMINLDKNTAVFEVCTRKKTNKGNEINSNILLNLPFENKKNFAYTCVFNHSEFLLTEA